MNVANIDLSKELYELSGWEGAGYLYTYSYDHAVPVSYIHGIEEIRFPAYDLGTLLRKLPEKTTLRRNKPRPIKASNWHGEWCIGVYGEGYRSVGGKHGATPEDAACKLAIELFKQGVLTKE